MIARELESPNRTPEMTEALTHPSFSNEHNLPYSNQRLEFLGDAILGAVISEYLVKIFPGEDEGTMTRLKAQLTCAHWCIKIADKLNLQAYLKIGNGLSKQGWPESILGDAMESVIGAYFLTHGWNATRDAILEIWEAESINVEDTENYKGVVQEYCQKHRYELRYVVEKQQDGKFAATLFIDGLLISKEIGNSKKEAEIKAAKEAIRYPNWQFLVAELKRLREEN